MNLCKFMMIMKQTRESQMISEEIIGSHRATTTYSFSFVQGDHIISAKK